MVNWVDLTVLGRSHYGPVLARTMDECADGGSLVVPAARRRMTPCGSWRWGRKKTGRRHEGMSNTSPNIHYSATFAIQVARDPKTVNDYYTPNAST